MVDSHGTAPVTLSLARIWSSASAAHSAIAVNDRAPASTAHTAIPKITSSSCRMPQRCRGSAALASNAGGPSPAWPQDAPGSRWQGQSVKMTRRAWSLGSDPGVRTAMITPQGPCPRCYRPITGVP
jgi:hypothetical protein